jgi:hypothetical protein
LDVGGEIDNEFVIRNNVADGLGYPVESGIGWHRASESDPYESISIISQYWDVALFNSEYYVEDGKSFLYHPAPGGDVYEMPDAPSENSLASRYIEFVDNYTFNSLENQTIRDEAGLEIEYNHLSEP